MTIDVWTLALQTVNVLILIWLLQRFFWRPVSAMIARRHDAAGKMLAEAARARDAGAAGLAEIAQIRAGFGKERETILAAAQADAAKLKQAAEQEAAAAAKVLAAAAQLRIQDEQRKAASASRQASISLAVDIAARLAARLKGPSLRATFLDWLLNEIAALPESSRSPGEKLELTSAVQLPAAEAQEFVRRIAAAYGGAPEITLETDPALIEGLELRSRTLWLQNSWRADVNHIAERLRQNADA